jgi:hypothetical protein
VISRGAGDPNIEVTMNHANGGVRATGANAPVVPDKLLALTTEALAFVSRDRAERMARQWLAGVPLSNSSEQSVLARSLALELALSMPSLKGVTAIDRLARAMKGRPPEDATAVALLRRSRLRLSRLSGERFEDLTTGETLPLLPTPSSDAVGNNVAFGRFTTTEDGYILATGTLVLLDDGALVVARGFVRPGGRGIGNPVRCAEAVYRHIIRNGASTADWRGPIGGRQSKLPFEPDRNPLDALAAAWASLDRELNPEEIAKARSLAGQGPLLDALVSISIARDGRAPKLANAYGRIASVMVETMALRALHGSAREDLDTVAAEIKAAIARGDFPAETKSLFEALRKRVGPAAGRGTGDTADIDRLVQRIQALRAKTVEQGCTEQEALAAAEKVAELLDRYGLSLSELDLRRQSCEGIGVETDRKRRGPIDDCMGTIAAFFDCRVWCETSEDATLRYIFFGLPADVQAAVYLHDLIALAFATETSAFQATEIYRSTHSSRRRSATNSFQVGLARGIIRKLDTLRHARDVAGGSTNGRALVPIKESIIDAEMDRLGLSLRRRSTVRRMVLPAAFSAGQEAGERFEYRPGLEGGEHNVAGGQMAVTSSTMRLTPS